jgi:hypothetical protein
MRPFLVPGLALLGACARADILIPPPTDNHEPKRIEILAPFAWLQIGDQDSLRLKAYDAASNEVSPPAVQWVSDHPAIARVDGFGVVTGIAMGQAQVTARSGVLSASVVVKVRGRDEFRIRWGASGRGDPPLVLPPGGALQVRAELVDGWGDLLPQQPRVRWISTAPQVASIQYFAPDIPELTQVAVVTGISAGSASIRAEVAEEDLPAGTNRLAASVSVTVLQPVLPGSGELLVREFRMVPYYGNNYVPVLRVEAASEGGVDLLGLEITLGGTIARYCGIMHVTSQQAQHLNNGYVYGDYDIMVESNAQTSEATAVLVYRLGDGGLRRMEVTGPVGLWSWPPFFPPGPWGFWNCPAGWWYSVP